MESKALWVHFFHFDQNSALHYSETSQNAECGREASVSGGHGLCCRDLIVFKAFHTTLPHLKPLPKAICQTRSPLLMRPLASQYASSYHTEADETFPYLYNVARDGSMCRSWRRKLAFIVSRTLLPPAWMQKCWKAVVKSGM